MDLESPIKRFYRLVIYIHFVEFKETFGIRVKCYLSSYQKINLINTYNSFISNLIVFQFYSILAPNKIRPFYLNSKLKILSIYCF